MSVKICRLEIVSFGKLKNKIVELSDGINLLSAPNESGKSTLASFLRFVLYGYVDGKKQDLSENDKKLYTPWDNPKSEGSVVIEKDGKQYRVSRSYLSTKDNYEIIGVATGNRVFDGIIPGVALLGLSEEVFSRTLFFRQLPSAQGKDSVIADQLQNLAVSADDQVSSKAATEKLNKAKNELKGRILGTGIIPRQEKECSDLNGRMLKARDDWNGILNLRRELETLSNNLSVNANRQAEVDAEMSNLIKWEAGERARMLDDLREKAFIAESEYQNAASLIQTHDGEDSAFLAGLLSKASQLEGIKNSVRMTEESIATQEKLVVGKKPALMDYDVEKIKRKLQEQKMWVISLGVFGLILLAAGIATCFFLLTLGLILCGIGLAGIALAVLFQWRKKRTAQQYGCSTVKELDDRIHSFSSDLSAYQTEHQKLNDLKNSLQQLQQTEIATQQEIEDGIHSYRIEVGGDFSEQVQKLIVACTELAGLKTKYQAANDTYFNALGNDSIDDLKAKAQGSIAPERSKDKVELESKFLLKQKEMLASQKTDKSVNLASLEAGAEDPALLESKKNALSQVLDRNRLKYEAYEAAKEGIQEAANYMKSMVAPHLSEIAEQYFKASTDGKYQKLTIDTRLAMSTEDQGMTRECDFLSAGTKDCVYLSLRLALVDLLFDGTTAPIVLDDSFGRLDRERLQATMRMLGKAGQQHQILLLTCCDREEKAFLNENITYHVVEGL